MATYRIFYRTAQAIDNDGNPVGVPGAWLSGPDVDASSLPASFPISGLTNGTAYEFVAGRVDNGSFRSLSTVRRATPVAANSTYNSIGPQTINSGGLQSFDRQATKTTITMSNASWVHVYLDWASNSAGVARGNKALPAPYLANTDVIRQLAGSNTVVEILLPSSTAFTFRVVAQNTSITVSLAVVA
jgi:hypothetical protein